jgi:hypothetical protein
MEITKKGLDEIRLEMYAFVFNSYIELHGGEIRQNELGETEALVQFTFPK